MGDDVELFSLPEMAAAFDLDRVSANPARFDLKKCQAINAEHVRRLDPDDLTERILPFLQGAGVLPGEPTDEQRALLRAAVPLVQDRMTLLTEAVGMLGFLFVDDVALELEEASVAALPDDAATTLSVAYDALVQFEHWTAADIEGALRVVPGRRPRPEAQDRLHSRAGGRHRAPGVPAAVRVDGAARPGVVAVPAALRAGHAVRVTTGSTSS